MQYQPEEKVLCFHGPLMYQAKILMAEDWKGTENQHGAVGPHYLVHYQGWKKTWDEWVPDSRLLKYTDENLARQKALVDGRGCGRRGSARRERRRAIQDRHAPQGQRLRPRHDERPARVQAKPRRLRGGRPRAQA